MTCELRRLRPGSARARNPAHDAPEIRRLLIGFATALAALLPHGTLATDHVAAAQESAAPDALERRARQLAAAISADPNWPEDHFDETCRRNVPAASLCTLLADVVAPIPTRAVFAIEPGTSEPRDVLAFQWFTGGRLPGVASRRYPGSVLSP